MPAIYTLLRIDKLTTQEVVTECAVWMPSYTQIIRFMGSTWGPHGDDRVFCVRPCRQFASYCNLTQWGFIYVCVSIAVYISIGMLKYYESALPYTCWFMFSRQKNVFVFCMISQHWNGEIYCNPSSSKTETCLLSTMDDMGQQSCYCISFLRIVHIQLHGSYCARHHVLIRSW